MQVKGTPVQPPWASSGGRNPDNQFLGLVERTVIGVNNVYFDIAAKLRDRFWAERNMFDVINHALAENYRLHKVQPLRGGTYLPPAWMTTPTKVSIAVVPSLPSSGDGNLMFDRLEAPLRPRQGMGPTIESALLAANLRLSGVMSEGVNTAQLLVPRNAPGLSGEVVALLVQLGEWDTDRKAMMRTVRDVLTQTTTITNTGSGPVMSNPSNLALALTVMPVLEKFLPHEAHPLPTRRLLDLIDQEQARLAMSNVDMATYLPATVRLAKFDETTNAKKGTPRG
jgi:hypothetical protein